MFTTKVKSIIVAGAVALGTLAASSRAASAELRGAVYFEGPGITIGFGDSGYRDHGHRREYRRSCSPRKAVRKARNRGLRRAHIIRVNRRNVVVAGRKWGDRVVMGFANRPSCPVRFVRAR